jgi:hypothetical protein
MDSDSDYGPRITIDKRTKKVSLSIKSPNREAETRNHKEGEMLNTMHDLTFSYDNSNVSPPTVLNRKLDSDSKNLQMSKRQISQDNIDENNGNNEEQELLVALNPKSNADLSLDDVI